MNFACYQTLVENLKEIELIAQAADIAFGSTQATARIQGNAVTRAGLVLLCGYFEGFIRELAEEYIEILNEDSNLNAFPDQVFCTVVESMVGMMRQKNGVGAAELKSAILMTSKIQVNKKLFSKTGGNPSVDNIETVFNGLGLPKIIDELSIADYGIESTFVDESQVLPPMRQKIQDVISARVPHAAPEMLSEIVQLIEQRWSAKKKRRKVGYVNEIEQLLKKRNRIAHGEGNEQVTPTELRNFLASIEKLSEGLFNKTGYLLKKLTAA